MIFSGGERGKYPTWLAWDQSEENSLIRILLYRAETEQYLISLVPSLTNSVTKLVITLWCPSSAGGMSWCEVGSKLFCRVEFLLWSCCPAHCRSLLDHLGTQTLFSYWLCFLFALHTVFLSQCCKLSVVRGDLLVFCCSMALLMGWVLGNDDRKLPRGAQTVH